MHEVFIGRNGERTIRQLSAEEVAERSQPYVPTQREQEQNRANAYRSEADPLFFQVQRGEASQADYDAKIAEIRARYPYPA